MRIGALALVIVVGAACSSFGSDVPSAAPVLDASTDAPSTPLEDSGADGALASPSFCDDFVSSASSLCDDFEDTSLGSKWPDTLPSRGASRSRHTAGYAGTSCLSVATNPSGGELDPEAMLARAFTAPKGRVVIELDVIADALPVDSPVSIARVTFDTTGTSAQALTFGYENNRPFVSNVDEALQTEEESIRTAWRHHRFEVTLLKTAMPQVHLRLETFGSDERAPRIVEQTRNYTAHSSSLRVDVGLVATTSQSIALRIDNVVVTVE